MYTFYPVVSANLGPSNSVVEVVVALAGLHHGSKLTVDTVSVFVHCGSNADITLASKSCSILSKMNRENGISSSVSFTFPDRLASVQA